MAKRKEEKKKEKKDFAACAIHTRFQNTDKLREREIKKLTTDCMKNKKRKKKEKQNTDNNTKIETEAYITKNFVKL